MQGFYRSSEWIQQHLLWLEVERQERGSRGHSSVLLSTGFGMLDWLYLAQTPDLSGKRHQNCTQLHSYVLCTSKKIRGFVCS